METRQLVGALAVARHGSFTAAARELFVSQSTLSRRVTALERELGLRLFERGPRVVALTDGGRAFLDAAQAVLAALDKALLVALDARAEAEPPAAAGEPALSDVLR